MPRLTWRPERSRLPPPTEPRLVDGLHVLAAAPGRGIVEVGGVLDLRPVCPPIDNQFSISDCVADSTTAALELLEVAAGLPFAKKSRLFLYYNARLQTQETDRDEGTYIRLAFASLTTLGTCTEATWPYDASQVFIRPSWRAYREAFPNKISSFYRIDSDGSERVDQVQRALRAQHPVVFGMTVDRDYMGTGSDGVVAMPRSNRQDAGGHAQVIVGYDDHDRWIVRNSWGVGWGDGGYGYVPYGYLDASGADDLWVPYRAPTVVDSTTVTVTRG